MPSDSQAQLWLDELFGKVPKKLAISIKNL